MQPRQQTNRYLVFRWGSRRHDWTMPRSGWKFLEQYQWGRKLGIDCFSVLLYHGVHGLPIPESSVDLNVNGGTNKGWSTGQDDDVSRYAQLMTNWPIFGNVCTDAIPKPMQSAFFPLSMLESISSRLAASSHLQLTGPRQCASRMQRSIQSRRRIQTK